MRGGSCAAHARHRPRGLRRRVGACRRRSRAVTVRGARRMCCARRMPALGGRRAVVAALPFTDRLLSLCHSPFSPKRPSSLSSSPRESRQRSGEVESSLVARTDDAFPSRAHRLALGVDELVADAVARIEPDLDRRGEPLRARKQNDGLSRLETLVRDRAWWYRFSSRPCRIPHDVAVAGDIGA